MPTTPLIRALFAAALCAAALCATAPLAAEPYPVGLVPSDDAALAAPVERTAALTPAQVLGMVRRAVDLVGGMAAFVPDTARVVLLKVNISTAEPSGSGIVTDARVARAVGLLVHEVAPEARIVIGEAAGGWMSPALRDCTDVERGGRLLDGFEIAGHRETVRELRARGIDIECYDLNFDRAYSLHPDNGGLADSEYSIAAMVLDADVFINVPLAKTHGAKITAAMKNHFGILPGRIYGWSKSRGTQHHRAMPHSPRQMDEAWIDLYGLTRVDLNVVDMIAGSEAGAFEDNNTQRMNIVLAGANPIAVDLVAAKLMGFNPDDFEFAELAWQHDLGPRTIDDVDIRGADPGPLVTRWKKAGIEYGGWGEWAEHANYGMGPRYWTLLGPLPRDHALATDELADLAPVPGRDGWSETVYFGHDRINLDKHFDDPVHCAVYAFTRFTMAQADSVRFWIGSDEELSLWLNGELLYEHSGRRRHQLGMERLPGFVEAGEHRLLVRAGQGRGDFEFSFNVTEPIDDPFYAGNRYPGVRYFVEARERVQPAARRVDAESTGNEFRGVAEEASFTTMELAEDPLERSRSAADTVMVDAARPRSVDLLALLAERAQIPPAAVDETTLLVLGTMPFTTSASYRSPAGVRIEVSRMLDWLGLRYAVTYGLGRREALKNIHGWLAMGYTPVIPEPERRRRRRSFGSGPARWSLVTGYRQAGDTIELRLTSPRGQRWQTLPEDWTASLPGGALQSCPVFVVDVGADPLPAAAVADSIAAMALELAWPRHVEEEEDWGVRHQPVALAQWDRFVIDWERMALTPEWARQPYALDRLERMGRYPFPMLAEARALAARYFREATARAADPEQRRALAAVAEGYGRVASTLEDLLARLPEEDELENLSFEDIARLASIAEARPLMRAARDGERAAVMALAEMHGHAPPPPAVEDPLLRKDRGERLFTWSAVSEDNVLSLVLEGEDLQTETIDGDDPDDVEFEVHRVMPRRQGWEVAVEVLGGIGSYSVEEAPSAANGWRLRLLADYDWVRGNHMPEIVVWAVPPE